MRELISSSSTRIKTALVLFAVFCLVSYIDNLFLTWLFLGTFMIVGVHEAMKLFKVEESSVYQYALITWIVAYFYPQPETLFLVAIVVAASILAYKRDIDKKIFLPLLYPLASFLVMLSLYVEYGIGIFWWMMFIVASADIGAYYTGRAIGKRKFCTTSPNKTLEGVFGGIFFAGLLGPIFALEVLAYPTALVISVLVAIASVFGDLFESYLKREADVKDSGDIFPGHGGVLDRTDGFLFASIVMFVVLGAVII